MANKSRNWIRISSSDLKLPASEHTSATRPRNWLHATLALQEKEKSKKKEEQIGKRERREGKRFSTRIKSICKRYIGANGRVEKKRKKKKEQKKKCPINGVVFLSWFQLALIDCPVLIEALAVALGRINFCN